jgi:hypothetical protein
MADSVEPLALDYFSGGVPAGPSFQMAVSELRKISDSAEESEHRMISRLHEICFIGLVSYFEAFCKDHFASLLNIEPNLVTNLKQGGQSVEIDATRVLLYGRDLKHRIGFLLAEKFDFGTAQKINSLFGALLKITPFGKEEAARYSALLSDRNLLVHHGGTFTLAYLEQAKLPVVEIQSHAFYNSHIKGKSDVLAAMAFLEGIAKKIINASHAALTNYLAQNAIEYSGEHLKALDYALWWDEI